MATSRIIEGHCADIEHLLREGSLRQAVRLATALPEICAAVESPRLSSTRAEYAHWCEIWLKVERSRGKPITGVRVYALHARRIPPPLNRPGEEIQARPLPRFRLRRYSRGPRTLARFPLQSSGSPLEAFQIQLAEALVAAARRWYEEQGRRSSVVQANLGKLAMR
jgi:hypothetical protein